MNILSPYSAALRPKKTAASSCGRLRKMWGTEGEDEKMRRLALVSEGFRAELKD